MLTTPATASRRISNRKGLVAAKFSNRKNQLYKKSAVVGSVAGLVAEESC